MSDYAIRVMGLGKRYRIGERRSSYATLRERLAQLGRPRRRTPLETFWALRDVSFDLQPGEVLGVIGANGAGKSTLLKILSRITDPDEGEAYIRGRVRSLLEVGTGFHPELTGRENVYLNGAILGMKRAEIRRKFDEIVAFAEVERFIDTPVKHYSSGMYLRLAFAVAAHLEPEILVVDEVLAVGDIAFQQKCVDKMDDTAKQGRTVVFVSHNLSAVVQLCQSAALLKGGRLVERGPAPQVVEQYLQGHTGNSSVRIWDAAEQASAKRPFLPLQVRITQDDGEIAEIVRSTRPAAVEIEYRLLEAVQDFRVVVKIYSAMGELLFMSFDRDDPTLFREQAHREPGHYISRCWIPENLLNRGSYVVGVTASTDRAGLLFGDQYALRFRVDVTGGVGTQWRGDRGGLLRPALVWETERVGRHDRPLAEIGSA